MKRTVNTTAANLWNSKVFFPRDNYILRCIGEDNGVSSGGNPMTTLEWEIVNCEPKQIGDDLIDFDGVKFKSYHVTRVNGDEKKSDGMFKAYQDKVLVPCGIDCSEGWDDENPPSVKGKVVCALVNGDEKQSFASPSTEERAKGIKIGKPLKDPITGKEVVLYRPELVALYGLYEGEVRPF